MTDINKALALVLNHSQLLLAVCAKPFLATASTVAAA
jgi:hypothetical protein